MEIKKFKDFNINEQVEEDMQNRLQQLEQTRQRVQQITNQAQGLANLNDEEAIDTQLENLVTQNEQYEDSMISLALTLARKIGDRKKMQMRIEAYENEIPELQDQIDQELQELMANIDELKNQ